MHMTSQRMTQTKLFKQFNKLLDNCASDMDKRQKKGPQIGLKKLTKQLKLDK